MDKYDKLYIWHIVTLARIKCKKKRTRLSAKRI